MSDKFDLHWNVIFQIAEKLNVAGIPYHFDASTSLFVHGIEIDMDDVDVSIEWTEFEDARALFASYGPTQIILKDSWHQFRAEVDGVDVHFLSGEGMTDLPSHPERNRIVRDGAILWSKAVEFYRRHMNSDHRWISVVDQYLEENSKNL
jgi:hypothetical protein